MIRHRLQILSQPRDLIAFKLIISNLIKLEALCVDEANTQRVRVGRNSELLMQVFPEV